MTFTSPDRLALLELSRHSIRDFEIPGDLLVGLPLSSSFRNQTTLLYVKCKGSPHALAPGLSSFDPFAASSSDYLSLKLS